MPEFEEKRPFSRVDFNSPARLIQGDQEWSAEVLDVSLKGILLALPNEVELQPQLPVDVEIRLSPQINIHMACRIARHEHGQLGLACESIDLTSIQHLRRLVELNLGDSTIMEREITELIAPNR